jgi:hypothetical protein
MGIIRVAVTQGGADTLTQVAIPTSLTADGRMGWLIKRLTAMWSNGYTSVAADQKMSAILSTKPTTATIPTDSEELARVVYAVSNTAGVAVAYTMELQKTTLAAADRVTVQPYLYATVESAGTALANLVYFEIEYEDVKMTDLEVLRLLVGGA